MHQLNNSSRLNMSQNEYVLLKLVRYSDEKRKWHTEQR